MNDTTPNGIGRSTRPRPIIARSTLRGAVGVVLWELFVAIFFLHAWHSGGGAVRTIVTTLSLNVMGCGVSLGEKYRSAARHMTDEQRDIVVREIRRAALLAIILSTPVMGWILFSAWNEGPFLVIGMMAACFVTQVAPSVLFGRSNGRDIVASLQRAAQRDTEKLGDKLQLWAAQAPRTTPESSTSDIEGQR